MQFFHNRGLIDKGFVPDDDWLKKAEAIFRQRNQNRTTGNTEHTTERQCEGKAAGQGPDQCLCETCRQEKNQITNRNL